MSIVTGRVFERLSGGGIGRTISNAQLTFTEEQTERTKTTECNQRGAYQIELQPARYHVLVKHPDYQDFSTGQGFVVVRNYRSVANFFLKPAETDQRPFTSVFRGRIFERNEDGFIGDTIDAVQITFISEETSNSRSVHSSPNGSYSIELLTGRYFITANRQGYESYSSEPSSFLLRSDPTTANIFLKPSQITIAPSKFTFHGDRIYNRRTTL